MNEETPIKPESYSVKTTSDITERIQELTKKTGLSQKDLFAAMVTKFYTEIERGSEIDQSDDMQQIRYHLNRVENIFLGSLQKVKDLKKDYENRTEQQINHYKDVIEDLQKQKVSLSKEFDKLAKTKEESEKGYHEVQQRNKELEEANQANRLTIDLLSQKIKELEAKLQEASTLADQVQELQEETLSLREDHQHLQSDLTTAQQTISHLKKELAEKEQSSAKKLKEAEAMYQKKIEEMKTAFEKEVQQIQEVHKLELEKRQLEAERQILEKVQAVKEESTQKIDLLLAKNEQLINKNQELTEKLHTNEIKLQSILQETKFDHEQNKITE